MRIIPSSPVPPDDPILFETIITDLHDAIPLEPLASESESDAEAEAARLRSRPAAMGAPGAHRSQNYPRDDSVLRAKAAKSRRGSRRERRWMNRAALAPTPEDYELSALEFADGNDGYSFSSLRRLDHALAEWEAGMEAAAAAAAGGRRDAFDDDSGPAVSRTSLERYTQIDSHARGLLRSGKVDPAFLDETEMALRHHFLSNPTVPLVLLEPNGFRRCILHSVAQYLNLRASSSDTTGVGRITTVASGPDFTEPPQPLSQVLMDMKQNNGNGQVRCGFVDQLEGGGSIRNALDKETADRRLKEKKIAKRRAEAERRAEAAETRAASASGLSN